MSSDELYQAPSIEELAKRYEGANILIMSHGDSGLLDASKWDDIHQYDVWTLNGGWLSHPYSSLGFLMDDLGCAVWDRIENHTRPEVEKTIRSAKCPIITSVAYDGYPMMVEFPLVQAIEDLPVYMGELFLNETINYMMALAIMFKVARIDIIGADYKERGWEEMEAKGIVPKRIRPDKMAAMAYWIGVAMGRGIDVRVKKGSALMYCGVHDPVTEIDGLYGYQVNNIPDEARQHLELLGGGRAKIKIGGVDAR